MEVAVPVVPSVDFNLDSGCSYPYMTAPFSPQRLGNDFFSASTSPTRASSNSFYSDHHQRNSHGHNVPTSSASVVPFGWEEKTGIPKSNHENGDDHEDFEFNFGGQLLDNRIISLSADELFDGGKIKPLKPPPRLQINDVSEPSNNKIPCPKSPRSSKISQGKKIVQEVLSMSPRHRKKDFDPFEAALKETRKLGNDDHEQKRGREKNISPSSSSSSANFTRKAGTRSLSPMRVSDIVIEQDKINISPVSTKSTTSTYSSLFPSFPFSKGYRKWKLKDLLLFRSASEGRATDHKGSFRQYAMLSKKGESEDVKNSSFRSMESAGSVSSSRRRSGPVVSAHELHYTENRAASEEMKRKTFLPYKQGLLGCLGFSPGMREISRGIGL